MLGGWGRSCHWPSVWCLKCYFEIILGTSDAWPMRRLTQWPSDPAYYIEDCWIFTYLSFLAGLGQKPSVIGMLVFLNGPRKTRFNFLSKVENKHLELTVLTIMYILWGEWSWPETLPQITFFILHGLVSMTKVTSILYPQINMNFMKLWKRFTYLLDDHCFQLSSHVIKIALQEEIIRIF